MSSTLQEKLFVATSDAFAQQGLERRYGEILPSSRPDLGQFQCNGALAAAKAARRKPTEIAAALKAALIANPMFADISVAGPGFMNFKLADAFLAEHMNELRPDPRLGCPVTARPQNVIVDFGGPNVAKAMHVGHLRSSIIGDCLQRLFRFQGHAVTSDIHMGDWGTQMGMLLCEVRRLRPDLPFFDARDTGPYPSEPVVTIDELNEMYPRASARAKSDPEEMIAARVATADLQSGRPGYRALWQQFVAVTRAALEADFGRLGIKFDLWLGESSVQDRIGPMIERIKAEGNTEISQGALVVPLAEESDQTEIPPLILVKSDGGVMYGTTDLATLEHRISDLHAEVVLYVVDKRQSTHFEQVFRAARKTKIAPEAKLEHIAFGTMNGQDGRPFKTREGGVMRLGDLLAMATDKAKAVMQEAGLGRDFDEAEMDETATKVGIAAVKFADLVHNRVSDYVFDIDKFTSFDGCTGPYLLYAAVRMQSILRKAAEMAYSDGPLVAPTDVERDLVLKLCQLPAAVDDAEKERAPHHLCNYAYELAKCFSRFYEASHILKEPDEARRGSLLSLTRMAFSQMQLLLTTIGIEIPARM